MALASPLTQGISMAGPEVISVYRSILKAAHKTFRGDISTLSRTKFHIDLHYLFIRSKRICKERV